jgi:hypothetical protein
MLEETFKRRNTCWWSALYFGTVQLHKNVVLKLMSFFLVLGAIIKIMVLIIFHTCDWFQDVFATKSHVASCWRSRRRRPGGSSAAAILVVGGGQNSPLHAPRAKTGDPRHVEPFLISHTNR